MTRCCDLDGVTRFSGLADIYAKGRPSYPREAIAFVAPDPHARILDIGAGTGISARLLHATGVDPNLDMILASNGATKIAARAELLPFRDGVADVIAAFNAFHWFQPEAFFAEARRVLAPRGRLALVWNDWDLGDAFTAEFVRLMRSRAGDYPPEDREAEVAPLYATPRFTRIERKSFPNTHELDLETLRLRIKSMSYIPREGPDWDALSIELTALYERYKDVQGIVRHRYHTSVFVAEPAT